MSVFARDLNNQPNGGIWNSLNRLVIALILMCASVPVAYSFLPEVTKRKEQRQRIESLKADLEREKMQLARFEREETLMRRDSDYAGLIARDKLDLMKEGETIYRLDPPKIDPAKLRRNP
ncbi:MAG: septum formation initiator family protein [Chthoniobacteraceae bacterium]